MKIACIGNMNNVMFAVTRYLRDLGHQAELFMFPGEGDHFHPSADTFNLDFMNYCHQLYWGDPFSFSGVKKEIIQKTFESFDFLIGSGTAPAFLQKSGINLDLFIPYGTDIESYLKYKIVNPKFLLSYFSFITAHRKGVKNSKNILLNTVQDSMERDLQKLGLKGNRIYKSSPYLYNPQYENFEQKKLKNNTHWGNFFKSQCQQTDLIIFHHSRQLWSPTGGLIKGTPYQNYHNKNDILLKGVKDFLLSSSNKSIMVNIIEYGPDVFKTKELIKALQLEKNVTWLPKMNRKDIIAGIYYSNIVVGELYPNALTYCVASEALAMGKPFMAARENSRYLNEYPELYPMMNVQTSKDIAKSITKYINDPDHYIQEAQEGKEWFNQNITLASMKAIEQCILKSGFKNKPIEPISKKL